ncbi:hypothetical protein HPB47_018910, partial [Ixodes persulcatus]
MLETWKVNEEAEARDAKRAKSSYSRAVAKKWNASVYRNVSECMGYTDGITTFWFDVRIIDRNVKSGMPHDFAISLQRVVPCGSGGSATPLVHFVDPGDSEPMSDILGMEALDGLDERPVARQDRQVYDRQEVDGLEVAGVPDDLAELPEEIQLGIAKIKESLHCSDGSAADLLDLRFLATANPETVAAVCDEMETESISDAKMAALLRSFVELKSETSLINGVVFTKRALLPKIESWKESSAPRLLVESVAAFVTALPQVSVEGLLVPLAQLAHPGKAQAEVLQAAVKEGIPKDYAPLCLRRILQESKANTEAMIGLIHCLVSKRGPLGGRASRACGLAAGCEGGAQWRRQVCKAAHGFPEHLRTSDVSRSAGEHVRR